ncbi:MAG: FKBP-type peptidyl-prolyl cis-trans isomerase [archaeon]|nr:FKBP-type peptidyl-prolyl cis-trans isomerase [archaeon]
MKEKSLVLIEFTGKELESGRIFDTTNVDAAKKAGLFRENAIFGQVPVVVGNADVLKGMDDALRELKEGEMRKIILEPEKAFGNRRKELVVVIPIAEFKKRKISPVPGLIVDLNGGYGRVQTVSGGRVRVDMNSDLAGKTIEFELKIVREVKEPKEKAQVLTQKYFPLKNQKVETELVKDTLKVKIPKEIAAAVSQFVPQYIKLIKELIPEIKKVEVEDSHASAKGQKIPEGAHVHADGTVHFGEH